MTFLKLRNLRIRVGEWLSRGHTAQGQASLTLSAQLLRFWNRETEFQAWRSSSLLNPEGEIICWTRSPDLACEGSTG